ncbi:MAG: ATPase, T2SS/T4P/T4SS family [Planctomycetota bacterium]
MLHEIPELLARKQVISADQLARIRELEAREPEERIDQLLLKHEIVTEDALLTALAEAMGFQFLDLANVEPSREALEKTPPKFVFKHRVLPISFENNVLTVATSEPFEILALDELETMTGFVVEPVFCVGKEIAKQIKSHFGVGGETIGDLVGASDADDAAAESEDEEEMAESASVIRLVNEILCEAVRERASDIHIEPGETGMQIRYRIDGVLQSQSVPPEIHRFQAAIASRLKIMAKLNIAEKRKPQDGRIRLKVDDREVDLRVSIIPMLHGEGIVMRILDKGKMTYDLQKIGMDPENYGAFKKLICLPHGIILVTGPTGSGKSTTLYSALAEIKDEATKIITVEDPVEYQMPGISQIQVNHKVGLDFAAGLRSILRHDPDVILIGEIRDFETAQIATQAAMTGHMVFSTLHTNDAPSAFPRLIDMGVEPYLVASTVMGVMAQRLVRTICPGCKAPKMVDPTTLPADFPNLSVGELMAGVGCEKCRQSGYSGRQGIYELLSATQAIQQLVVNRSSGNEIKRQAMAEGMSTLRQCGWLKVLAGLTTVEEIARVTKEEELAPATGPGQGNAAPKGNLKTAENDPVILSMPKGGWSASPG